MAVGDAGLEDILRGKMAADGVIQERSFILDGVPIRVFKPVAHRIAAVLQFGPGYGVFLFDLG